MNKGKKSFYKKKAQSFRKIFLKQYGFAFYTWFVLLVCMLAAYYVLSILAFR